MLQRKQSDESEQNFEPPWVKERKKETPILWDYTGYRPSTADSMIHSQEDNRPSSSASFRILSASTERGKNTRTNTMGQDNRRPWR